MENSDFEAKIKKNYNKTNSPRKEAWYKGSLHQVSHGHRIADMVSRHLDIKDKKVLDIGCGDGGVSVAFAQRGADVVGIDLDPDRIDTSTLRANDHRLNVKFFVDDAEKMSLNDNSYDVVVCNALIEHVFNPEELASEISRVLKNGGILFLDTPSRYSVLQLISDTHYGLFGISIMPRWLATYYTVKIRKRHNKYNVDYLRTYGYLKRIFNKNNIVFIDDANITYLVNQIEGKIPLPQRGLRSNVVNILKRLHLSWLLIGLVKSWFYRTFITSGWSLIGKKYL